MKYLTKIALEHFAFGLVIPISIIWKLNNGLSLVEAAGTEALILLVTALCELPAGFFADKFGNKKSLIVGGILHSLAAILMVIGGSFEIFVLAALLSGAAWAFISGADEAYLHDDYLEKKEDYHKAYANMTIVDEVFTIAGLVLSSTLLYTLGDLRTVLIISTVFISLSTLYALFFLPARRRTVKHLHADNVTPNKLTMRSSLSGIHKIFPWIIAFALLYESGRVLWQPHMQNIGINIASFGLIFALFKAASIVGSLVARKHTAFTAKKLFALFSLMLLSIILFASSSIIVSVVALVIFLFTENYFRIYMSVVLNKLIKKRRASILSLSSFVRNITGSGLIVAVGFMGQTSILIALIALAAFKIPGVIYILRNHKSVFHA